MVKRDYDSQNIYTVTVGQCNQQKLVEESKYEEKTKSASIVPGEYISKKEPGKIPETKTIRLYIVPCAPSLLYQQGNQNSCIVLSLALTLHYMGDEYASEFIIKREKNTLWGLKINVKCTYSVIFLWDITNKKTKQYSIIVMSNGINPHNMIYFGNSIIIQLCVCY